MDNKIDKNKVFIELLEYLDVITPEIGAEIRAQLQYKITDLYISQFEDKTV